MRYCCRPMTNGGGGAHGGYLPLTLYTVYSKRDWSFMEAGLSGSAPPHFQTVLLFFPRWLAALQLFGALLFSGYIFTSWQITERLGYDDHISLSSISCHPHLFLFILRLLSGPAPIVCLDAPSMISSRHR